MLPFFLLLSLSNSTSIYTILNWLLLNPCTVDLRTIDLCTIDCLLLNCLSLNCVLLVQHQKIPDNFCFCASLQTSLLPCCIYDTLVTQTSVSFSFHLLYYVPLYFYTPSPPITQLSGVNRFIITILNWWGAALFGGGGSTFLAPLGIAHNPWYRGARGWPVLIWRGQPTSKKQHSLDADASLLLSFPP